MVVKTHYDNLKVARNAPDDVIRAAYRSLIEKYHPTRNSSVEAARITKILDEAYETLSDPVRRKNHDQWIAREERREAMEQGAKSGSPTPAPLGPLKDILSSFMAWTRVNGRGKRLLVGALLVGTVAFVVWQDQRNPSYNDVPRTTQPYSVSPRPAPPTSSPSDPYVSATPSKPAYQRPVVSDNGYPWPSSAGYMKGYPKRNTNGLCEVHVDNGQNDSDVMVKLVSTSGSAAFPVRVFYIPSHGDFTVKNVSPGSYDVRFRTLANGNLSRSETFKLEQIPDADGHGERYSHYDLTLYTVANGNMQMYPLNAADF
jgi:hypothetical protein